MPVVAFITGTVFFAIVAQDSAQWPEREELTLTPGSLCPSRHPHLNYTIFISRPCFCIFHLVFCSPFISFSSDHSGWSLVYGKVGGVFPRLLTHHASGMGAGTITVVNRFLPRFPLPMPEGKYMFACVLRCAEVSRCVSVWHDNVTTGLGLRRVFHRSQVTSMTSLLDLPLEILDYIVDLLCGERGALEECCLVSKSLIPRARKYLFSEIRIKDCRKLQGWSRTCPDSPNSPAHHTRSLAIRCAEALTIEDGKEGSWIRSFTNVVFLRVRRGISGKSTPDSSFVPLHSLSSVKSLRLYMSFTKIRTSEIIRLLCVLPLLEDLDIEQQNEAIDNIAECKARFQHQPLPPLTGTLVLQRGCLAHIARLLSALPTGLRFRKILWKNQFKEDFQEVMALMEKCWDTLECIHLETPLFPFGRPPLFSLYNRFNI